MLGIIGGSGWSTIDWLSDVKTVTASTAYGSPSGPLLLGNYNTARIAAGKQARSSSVCFLARHGPKHHLPPHKINYRANVQAMLEAGVKAIVAINTVGSCRADWPAGSLVLPDQIIDYSYGREHTFFDTLQDFSAHIDFTQPFSSSVRAKLLQASERAGLTLHSSATYGCTQGPRLETAAEIRRMQQEGCDLVGMTLMPEAALCRERNLPVASLCIVVNAAAGVGPKPISLAEIKQTMQQASASVHSLIQCLLAQWPD